MNDKDSIEWQEPRDMLIPRPTAWPLGVAFGITFLLLGLITHWIVALAGFLVFVTSIVGWMGEMIRDGKADESHG